MWNLIPAESFRDLMLNWDELDFENIDLIKPLPKSGIDLILDDKIIIRYIHTKYDKTAITPTIKFVDVFYNKPWEYAIEKYNLRCKRMYASKETPVFLLVDDDSYQNVDTIRHDNSVDIINTLNESRFKYEIVWATKHNLSGNDFPNLRIKVIHPKSQYVGIVADHIIENGIIKI